MFFEACLKQRALNELAEHRTNSTTKPNLTTYGKSNESITLWAWANSDPQKKPTKTRGLYIPMAKGQFELANLRELRGSIYPIRKDRKADCKQAALEAFVHMLFSSIQYVV